MYDLTITEDLKDYLKEVRKALKQKGYTLKRSKCRRKIGYMQLNYDIEYWFKNNIMIEFEIDNNNNTLEVMFHFSDNGERRFKKILLSEVLEMI